MSGNPRGSELRAERGNPSQRDHSRKSATEKIKEGKAPVPGALRSGGGSQECPGRRASKRQNFWVLLGAGKISFKRECITFACFSLKKKKKKAAGKKKKNMGGTENSALGPFPPLFLSLGRRIQEKGFAFLGERY